MILTIFIKKWFIEFLTLLDLGFLRYCTDYIFETKNANICEKNMFLTIFVKKSFFFGAKKNFDGNFFIEITKKSEK